MTTLTKIAIGATVGFFLLVVIIITALFGGGDNYATKTASVLPPSQLIPTYVRAGEKYHVPWWFLATINKIETDYNQSNMVSPAGAIGPMQFMAGTWNTYGQNVTNNLKESQQGTPYNFVDAVFASANYLHSMGMPENPTEQDIAKFAGAYNAGIGAWSNMSSETTNYRAMAVQYSNIIKTDVAIPQEDINYWTSLPLSEMDLIAKGQESVYGTEKLPKITFVAPNS